MKIGLNKLILAILLLLFASLVSSYFYAAFAERPAMVELSLNEFDKKIPLGISSCFEANVQPNYSVAEPLREFRFYNNGNLFLKKNIDISNGAEISECIPSEMISAGNNFAEIYMGGERLFYNFSAIENLPPDQAEKYPAFNTVVINESWNEFNFNTIIGAILLCALIIVLMRLVFVSRPLLENLVFSFGVIFGIFSIVPFALGLIGAMSSTIFFDILLIILVALAIYFRKNINSKFEEKEFNFSSLHIVIIALIIFTSVFFNVFSESNVSYWTSFYERESSLIAASSSIPKTDPFSFLGQKPFGYVSGYFFIDAGFQWLFGMNGFAYFAVLFALSRVFLVAALYLFFSRALNFSEKQSALCILLFLLGGFVVGDFAFNVRHIIALGFVFMSLCLISRKQVLPAGICLGLALFSQPPIAIIFIVAGLFILGFRVFYDFIKTAGIGAIIAILLFLPSLISAGLPTEARSETWGYLWGMPFYGVMVDLFVFIIFFLLIILPLFLNGKLNLPRERTQICILLVLAAVLVLVQLFITYRVNVSTTLVLAVLAVLLFPREILETKFVSHVLSVLFVMGIAIAFSVVFAYSLPTAAQSTYGFIKFNTPQESNILADPALGHSLIYFAERKTLSDLAVEYAYEGMIDDSYKFLETRDISILGKYGINYVVNRSNYIEEQPVGSPYHDEKIEFEKLDKIYSNGTFYVHAYGR